MRPSCYGGGGYDAVVFSAFMHNIQVLYYNVMQMKRRLYQLVSVATFRMVNSSETIPEKSRLEKSIIKVEDNDRNNQSDQIIAKAIKDTIYNNSLYGVTQMLNAQEATTPEATADLIINLKDLNVSASKWWRFMALSALTERQKMQYIEMLLDNGLEEILDNNPGMQDQLARDLI